eukprot:scaffold21961_cov48-Phaeocystis_antarctica.AAC.2
MQTLCRGGGACELGSMAAGDGWFRGWRTHVLDAVHATGGRHPRLPGAELQCQSHHLCVWVGVDGRRRLQANLASISPKPLMPLEFEDANHVRFELALSSSLAGKDVPSSAHAVKPELLDTDPISAASAR